jgi:hypothetical protein
MKQLTKIVAFVFVCLIPGMNLIFYLLPGPAI